jgi:hypothetical protein
MSRQSVHPYSSPRSDLRVQLDDAIVEEMVAIANDPESETGGILVGRYLSDGEIAAVELASGPPGDSEAGVDWFKRGKDGLAELLAEQWSRPDRRYYVGEWHFHPLGNAEPSPQDLNQIREFAADENYRCQRPILIIVSPGTLRRRRPRVFVLGEGGRFEELLRDR